MSRIGTVFLALQAFLAVSMAGAGSAKLLGEESQVADFERFGYPQSLRLLTGGIEVLAALGLFAAFFLSDVLTLTSGILIGVVLVGAIGTHIRVGDSLSKMVPAFTLFTLALMSIWGAL